MAPITVTDGDSQMMLAIVDMPTGKDRSRLLAALRSGKYGAGAHRDERRHVNYADMIALCRGIGDERGAKGWEFTRDAVANIGAMSRAWRDNRGGRDSGAITSADLVDLYRSMGNARGAALIRSAEALAWDFPQREALFDLPGYPTSKASSGKGGRKLTPAQVKTLSTVLPAPVAGWARYGATPAPAQRIDTDQIDLSEDIMPEIATPASEAPAMDWTVWECPGFSKHSRRPLSCRHCSKGLDAHAQLDPSDAPSEYLSGEMAKSLAARTAPLPRKAANLLTAITGRDGWTVEHAADGAYPTVTYRGMELGKTTHVVVNIRPDSITATVLAYGGRGDVQSGKSINSAPAILRWVEAQGGMGYGAYRSLRPGTAPVEADAPAPVETPAPFERDAAPEALVTDDAAGSPLSLVDSVEVLPGQSAQMASTAHTVTNAGDRRATVFLRRDGRYVAAVPFLINGVPYAVEADAADAPAPVEASVSKLDALTPADRARVRIAVADRAPTWYRTPMVGGSVENAARYTAEGLHSLCAVYTLAVVWDAVAEQIEADGRDADGVPNVLTRSDANIAADRERRATAAASMEKSALVTYREVGAFAALSRIDAGVDIDPDYRTSRGRSWDDLRGVVEGSEKYAVELAASVAPAEVPAESSAPVAAVQATPEPTPVVEVPAEAPTPVAEVEVSAPVDLDAEVRRVLAGVTWSTAYIKPRGGRQGVGVDVLRLPADERLSRELYVAVAAAIARIGGSSWNKQAKGFCFEPSAPVWVAGGPARLTPSGIEKLRVFLAGAPVQVEAPAPVAEPTPEPEPTPVAAVEDEAPVGSMEADIRRVLAAAKMGRGDSPADSRPEIFAPAPTPQVAPTPVASTPAPQAAPSAVAVLDAPADGAAVVPATVPVTGRGEVPGYTFRLKTGAQTRALGKEVRRRLGTARATVGGSFTVTAPAGSRTVNVVPADGCTVTDWTPVLDTVRDELAAFLLDAQ